MIIFHIGTTQDWQDAQRAGRYEVESLRTQGFIHCSTATQVLPVADSLFRGREDLVLLRIDEERVTAEIKYENCEDGEHLFPHIYGPLDLEAVTAVYEFEPGSDGSFVISGEA